MAILVNTEKEAAKKKVDMKYQRDKEREMVKGVFHFYEVPGGSLSFVHKKYKEDPVEKFEMVDGQVYTVPLGVARHLNTNGRYPIHAYISGEDGKPTMKVGTKVARFGFQSLEFLDDSFNDAPSLISVEVTGIR